MKVLHVGKFYPPFAGGIENFMGELLPTLAKNAVECLALVHGDPKDKLRNTSAEIIRGVEVRRVPCYGRVLYAPVSPAFGQALDKTIAEFAPDLIHFHLPNTSAFWALFSSSAKKIPWVIHWHSDVVPSTHNLRLAAAYALYRPLEQLMLRRATAVIATSERYAKASNALQPYRKKLHVIPLGLADEPQLAGQGRASPLWGNATKRVLSIGRLTYYKGFDRLIEAARSLPDIKIIIVGEGQLYASLKKQIADLRVEQRILLAGALSDAELRSLLDSTDVFVLPSVERTEAFGLVLLEAMRAGKPVIASDIPGSGIGDVVVNGETGILVKPGDANALAGAISACMADKDKWAKRGEAGRRRFDEVYRIERVAEKTQELYNQAILEKVSLCVH